MTQRPCTTPPAAPRGSAMRYLCVALMCVCLFATGWFAGKVYGGSVELPQWLTRLGEMAAYNPEEPLLFNSGLFMLLFVAFTGIHTLCRRRRGLQMAAVIAFSLYFYWKSSATYCFILLGICLTDYGLGLTMGATRSRTMRRALVWANVLINVGMLVYFKYFNLLGQTLASITSTDFDPLDLVLPAGISFFSFRSMSYMVDLYRRRMEPCRSLADYLFFLTFFPPLLAGPVVRAADMLPQIRAGRPATRAMVSEGIFLVICGLVKKVIVADYLAGNFVDRIFDNPALYSGFENLMGVAGFTIQIYCDFSGYSDMAIGLALMLGFRFKDNFNAPFKSQSPTEFWRRWHISLSSWLRDYIYIPLGGNRRGKARQYVNLTVTMLAGGLWHGASWMYLLWGGYNGALLAAHKAVRKHWPAPRRLKGTRLLAAANITLTLALIMAGMMIFRAHTPADIAVMSRQILTDFRPQVIPSFIEAYMLITCIIAGAWMMHWLPRRHTIGLMRRFSALPTAAQAAILAIAIFFIIQTRQADLVPFVYLKY